ncbi:EAL domain-containing protein [Clostridium sp. Sa3CUN1]|uniref:EAL domain-containing protein n=1 Tax=Clostridium gallinarum TaxID=2762246 RepID=A0ABR8Q6A1_9CLOT|nr:EAL domain-containing protein [Clostridium gallinarum]MBD7915962.1 EAL domain-containing protein [Clostridium gallinarum]
MDSKKIKTSLYKVAFLGLILSIIVLYIGILIGNYYDEAKYNARKGSLYTKAEAYKIQIQRQIDADIQALYSVSNFFTKIDFNNLDDLYKNLYKANKQNHFMVMFAINKDGIGVKSLINKDEFINVNINDIQEEIQKINNKSLNGEWAMSDVFYSDTVNGYVVALSVPVYDEDEVCGTIIAYDTIDQFNSTLSVSIKTDDQEDYVNMIDSSGNFIVRSKDRLYSGNSDSIYNMDLKILNEWEVKEALSNGEDYYSLFDLDGIQYAIYFKALDYDDWYIYLINETEYKNLYMVKFSNITKIIFGFIIAIIIFFTLIIRYILEKNYKVLTNLAYYDELTGAYKSNKFREICEEALKTNKDYSIIAFNIKGFKFINNIFGEKWSDEFLIYIKAVLDKNTNKNEYFCRDGSDQFFIFMKSIDKNEIMTRVDKIKDEIKEFLNIKNQSYDIGIYGGICSYIDLENKENPYKSMLDNALFIMKEEKNKGFIFYDESVFKKRYRQNFIENNMQFALDNNEFKMFLQPKVDLKTNKISSAEVLVRWIRNDGTTIYPNEFIPLFEQNGFCEKLDMYMFEEACRKLKELRDKGVKDISISINQSKLLFYRADYIERISSITEKYGVPNSMIILEIIEGLTIDNFEKFNRTIDKLHKKGFRVSMDDFGSGYSAFNTLSRLEIDELKIDRDFLIKMENDKEKQKIILESIILLAKKLNITTVIEGVENKELLDFINRLGCDMAQGYYFSKPLSEEDFDNKYIK